MKHGNLSLISLIILQGVDITDGGDLIPVFYSGIFRNIFRIFRTFIPVIPDFYSRYSGQICTLSYQMDLVILHFVGAQICIWGK